MDDTLWIQKRRLTNPRHISTQKYYLDWQSFVNLPVLNDWNIQMESIVHMVIKNLYVNIYLFCCIVKIGH